MEKILNSYETLFVVDCSIGEEAVKATVEKFTAMIAENGTIENVDEWGKRRLAYPINDQNDGYYVLVNFKSEGEFPAELERVFSKAAELGVGIELNQYDMNWRNGEEDAVLRIYRAAKRMGCKFYLGTDAHHPDAFEKSKTIFERAIDKLELTEDDKYHIPI